ncbi:MULTISPECIES: hypothetical protein, partial [Streptomyces]
MSTTVVIGAVVAKVCMVWLLPWSRGRRFRHGKSYVAFQSVATSALHWNDISAGQRGNFIAMTAGLMQRHMP